MPPLPGIALIFQALLKSDNEYVSCFYRGVRVDADVMSVLFFLLCPQGPALDTPPQLSLMRTSEQNAQNYTGTE